MVLPVGQNGLICGFRFRFRAVVRSDVAFNALADCRFGPLGISLNWVGFASGWSLRCAKWFVRNAQQLKIRIFIFAVEDTWNAGGIVSGWLGRRAYPLVLEYRCGFMVWSGRYIRRFRNNGCKFLRCRNKINNKITGGCGIGYAVIAVGRRINRY